MKFCSHCGSDSMVWRVPDGDNRPRHVCDECEEIFYQNPNIVAGSIPVYGDRVLLCKRAIEPRYGRWTLPAGFMENGETIAEAAAREGMHGVVCGHIHRPEITTIGGIVYHNCGDWVESCTALVEQRDGRIELIDWHAEQAGAVPAAAA